MDPTFDPDRYAREEAEKKKGMTEEQSKSSIFANRMENSEGDITGFTPAATQGRGAYVGRIADNLPFGQLAMSPDFQVYNRAKYDWITASLRKESGAAINRDEYTKQEKIFFPQPGEDQRTIAAKAEARRVEVKPWTAAGPQHKSVVKPKQVASDQEVNDLVARANRALAEAPSPEARSQALVKVHSIMRQRGVPPQYWPK